MRPPILLFYAEICVCSRRSINERDHSVNDRRLVPGHRHVRIKVIPRSVDQKLGQHRQLLKRQRHIALWAIEFVGKVQSHDVEGRQGFAGMREQGERVDVGADAEDVPVQVAPAGVDGALGGLGTLGGIKGFRL